ncbi:hypothetical protein P9X10_02485 [Bacillus cereus]|nr:hypothetical protein [Bacillus cereus]
MDKGIETFRRDLHGYRVLNGCRFLTNANRNIAYMFRKACKEEGIDCHISETAYDVTDRILEEENTVGFYIDATLPNLEAFWNRVHEMEQGVVNE